MTRDTHRTPVPDRARRRAVRAHAARLGVSYSVAARLLRAQGARRPDTSAPATDEHRAWILAARGQRRFAVRVTDTRRAADLPLGRAGHLTERFPRMRVPVPLYGGDHRAAVLGVLYLVLAAETPAALPDPDDLAWVAELGEEGAVDVACATPDRAARLLLDGDRWHLWTRVEAALAATLDAGTDRRLYDAARTLDREFRTVVLRHSVDGARQILDAVLAGTTDGHAPGTRVRLTGHAAGHAGSGTAAGTGSDGTVVGARWSAAGPAVAYEVRVGAAVTVVGPEELSPAP
jgi:hypothetical protein